MPEDDVTCIRKARSLAEAFPEFYEALKSMTALADLYVPATDMQADIVIRKAQAILKRMRGES